MAKETLFIAGDHAATELKSAVIRSLPEFSWRDLGTSSPDSVDYPDYAEKVCHAIQRGDAKRAILLCGSGIGMCIAANKFDGIRAAVVERVETARLSREHNDANVLCLGARSLRPELALEIIRVWLTTPFSQGARHQKRIQKISAIEKKNHHSQEGL